MLCKNIQINSILAPLIAFVSLAFSLSAFAEVAQLYHLRETPGGARSLMLTNESCVTTGQRRGSHAQVRCQSRGRTITGWVHESGIRGGTGTVATRPAPHFTPSPTPVPTPTPGSRGTTPRQGPYFGGTGAGATVDDFTNVLLRTTPNRFQETRVVNARQGTRRRVDLIRMPEVRTGDPLGSPLCGAYRARNRSPLYFTAQAGCLMTAAAQEWRRNHCPDNAPHCRLVVGDASHGEERPTSWPHNTHRDGRCIDIYPMRQPGEGLTDSARQNGSYSRELTSQLIQVLRRYGAAPNSGAHGSSSVIFNDSRISGTTHWAGHENHIHLCFPENDENQRICDQTEFDTSLCPELRVPSTNPRNDDRYVNPMDAPGVAI